MYKISELGKKARSDVRDAQVPEFQRNTGPRNRFIGETCLHEKQTTTKSIP